MKNNSEYNYGTAADGAVLTPPASVPSTATVTGLSGQASFGNINSHCPGACPPQATATAYACLDVNDTQCFTLGTNNVYFPATINWRISVTAGKYPAATTKFHFAFVINNGTGLAILPPIYLTTISSTKFFVSYSY